MQSSYRSSKGKSRAVEEDYGDCTQSLASLSLSDCGDHIAPRSDSYGSPYTDVYGSSYDQSYPGDGHYSWTPQNSFAPLQSSSSPAAYGSSGYGNSYSTTSATSPTAGYDYRSQPSSSSTYGSYTGYDTASVTSTASSSYGGGSGSVWSDAHSHRTSASSTPSAHSTRTDVNNTIHRQRPPNERYQLPCEFRNLTGCDRVFPGDDVQGWMDHVEGHLQSKFPMRLRCWFCSDHPFDARETSGGDVRSNFITRMEHIRDHFVSDHSRPDQMLTDGYLVKHLFEQNLIDRHTYESILAPTTVPPVPNNQGRHSSTHRTQHSRHSHRRLPQVEEEEVVAGSSSRHHQRPEHRREPREHGSSSHSHSHKHKHRR